MDVSTLVVLQLDGAGFGGLLAIMPPLGGYASPVKLVMMLLVVGLWLGICGWVDRDAAHVKTERYQWLGVIYGAGVLGFIFGVLLPWSGGLFVVGWLILTAMVAGATLFYVKHRNTLVPVETRVTAGSMARRAAGWFSGKQVKAQIEEKIRITNARGNQVTVPKDNEEQRAYAAAQDLLLDAVTRRATDVDIVPSGERIRMAYRIDGVVTEREPVDRETGDGALTFLKQIAGLDVDERRRPQMGTIEASRGMIGSALEDLVSIEIRTSGSTAGERMILRILAEEANFRLPDLGLTPQQLAQLEAAAGGKDGLIIVSGPRSSGLTSTLYAFLRGCDAFTQNIHTLELDPSMDLENITQNVFDGQQEGVTFARRLQTILRRDPDILMVADCPDKDTARLLAAASGQRQRVYLGMSAKNSLEALKRYMTFVGDHELAAKPLRAVLCQRLVRILCENCREDYKPDPDMLRKANLPADRIEAFYKAAGTIPDKDGNPVTCPMCQGSGYIGRTGVFELMVFSEEMRQALSRGDLAKVKAIARKSKPPMLYLQEEGLRKVMAGTTSMKEFLRAIAAENSG